MTQLAMVTPFPAFDRLRQSASGVIKDDIANALEAMRSLDFLRSVFFDEFLSQVKYTSRLPWGAPVEGEELWTDYDTVKLTEWFQCRDVPFKHPTISTCLPALAIERARHPLREWLDKIQWDGIARIDSWLTYYLGAADTPFVRAVGPAWMISAVARVFDPGCKVDHMIVLEGKQGIGKSTAVKNLAGPEFFTDEIPELGSRDAALQLRGSWIIEMAELAGLARSRDDAVKAFLTRTTDKYRPPYGKTTVVVPRESVFIGTVNDTEWLGDIENRRYWPVRTTACDPAAIAHDREQLWAEAVARYRSGEKWWLTERDTRELAKREQADRCVTDPWDVLVDQYIADHDDVTINEILEQAIRLERSKWTLREKQRIGRHMARLEGWERYRPSVGSREWRYKKNGGEL